MPTCGRRHSQPRRRCSAAPRVRPQAGQLARAPPTVTEAEHLARTFADPCLRTKALTTVAELQDRAGQPDRAADIAAEAEYIAHGITNPESQTASLLLVA